MILYINVKEFIKAMPEDEGKPFTPSDEICTDREIAETVQTMNKGASVSYCLRWKDRQLDLFKET